MIAIVAADEDILIGLALNCPLVADHAEHGVDGLGP